MSRRRRKASVYWTLVEQRRRRIQLSRAELARRARISESTIYKGLHGGTRPEEATRRMVDLVLAIAEQLVRDGARP